MRAPATDSSLPVLYSFRRCPYAIRTRMALAYAGIRVQLREVWLRDKPTQMLSLSNKQKVPLMQLPDGTVLDESLDIIYWALEQNDPDDWMRGQSQSATLIAQNDGAFKQALDQYKYADRHPENPAETYRKQGELFLQKLEKQLTDQHYLGGPDINLADVALFPFVRQYAYVDIVWFQNTNYQGLQRWLQNCIESDLFLAVMHKYSWWQAGDPPVIFPD